MINREQVKLIIEGALLAAGETLSIERLQKLFAEAEMPDVETLKELIDELIIELSQRSFELKKLASGYRVQVKAEFSPWISKLWEERPARYSRALMETLAIIAYRQPVTRAQVEDIRGVAVSTNIVKTLEERQWIRVVGYRDVPGRPALFATTKQFLDDFNLQSLDQLPTLKELTDLDNIDQLLQQQLDMPPIELEEIQGQAILIKEELPKIEHEVAVEELT